VYLVGFIIRIYHDAQMQGPLNVKYNCEQLSCYERTFTFFDATVQYLTLKTII